MGPPMYLDDLTSCLELKEIHAEEAARSSASMRVFLRWAASVARPEEGAPKLLMAIVRLAYAGWLEGTPYVEVRGDETTTSLSIFCDHGVGIRERIFPLVRLNVPFDEFARAVRLAPHLVHPLRVTLKQDAFSLCPSELAAEDEAVDGARRDAIAIDQRSMNGVTRSPFGHGLRPITPAPPATKEQSGIHTRPTPRQMVAVRTAFLSRNGH